MTYKQLIDTLSTLIQNHRLINQWGYGNLSDIETPETGAPNYPYVFVNPSQVSIEDYGFTVNLNLIAMDQPLETVESEIDATSRMLGLIQDILGQFKNTNVYQDTDVNLSVICTPFKERFKDSVVGASANITFEVNQPLDVCDDIAPTFDGLVWAYTTEDIELGPEAGDNKSLTFDGIYFTDGNWDENKYIVQEAAIYTINIAMQITLNTPAEGEAIPQPPKLLQLTSGADPVYDPDFVTGWPTAFVDDTTVYDVTAQFTVDAPYYEGGYVWEFVNFRDQPGIPESTLIQKAGSEIKIYR